MTPIEGLFETHLSVTNLDRSVAFYRDVVGLSHAYSQPERGVSFWWIGAPGQAMLGLWQSNPVLQMRLHLAFKVSLAAVLAAPAALRQAGVTPLGIGREETDEPMVYCWMPSAVIFFDDPDGHSLEYLSMLPEPARPDLGIRSWSEWNTLTRD